MRKILGIDFDNTLQRENQFQAILFTQERSGVVAKLVGLPVEFLLCTFPVLA